MQEDRFGHKRIGSGPIYPGHRRMTWAAEELRDALDYAELGGSIGYAEMWWPMEFAETGRSLGYAETGCFLVVSCVCA